MYHNVYSSTIVLVCLFDVCNISRICQLIRVHNYLILIHGIMQCNTLTYFDKFEYDVNVTYEYKCYFE